MQIAVIELFHAASDRHATFGMPVLVRQDGEEVFVTVATKVNIKL